MLVQTSIFSANQANHHFKQVKKKYLYLKAVQPIPKPTRISSFNSVHVRGIKLYSSTIDATFRVHAKTLSYLTLENNTFNQSLIFSSLIINGNSNISFNLFNKNVGMNYTNFKDGFFIYKSDFIKFFSLAFARVQGSAYFYSNNFDGTVNFSQARFNKDAYFDHSNFKKETIFDNTHFEGKASFKKCRFEGNVDFSNTYFSTLLNLSHSSILASITFNDSHLPKYIDLSNMRINNANISFAHNYTKDHGRIKINVVGTNVNKVNFNYRDFVLAFPKGTSYEARLNIYTEMLEKYKKKGMIQSYKALYREKEQYTFSHNGQYLRNILSKYWWDYGLDKNRVYLWFLYFFSGLTIINTFFYDKFISKYFTIHFLNTCSPTMATNINPVVRYIQKIPQTALLTFFFIFATFLSMLYSETKVFRTNSVLINTYVILINTIGYIFILFFINTIIG